MIGVGVRLVGGDVKAQVPFLERFEKINVDITFKEALVCLAIRLFPFVTRSQ